MAYRLLLKRGEWDVDGFLRSIPTSRWEELKVAKAINDSYDDWLEAVRKGYKKGWTPPTFSTGKPKRRRLSGSEY